MHVCLPTIHPSACLKVGRQAWIVGREVFSTEGIGWLQEVVEAMSRERAYSHKPEPKLSVIVATVWWMREG